MSALRFSAPGTPTVLVDQRPSYARVGGWGGTLITPIVVKRVKGEYVHIRTTGEINRLHRKNEREKAARR